ncbi:MAG: putative lipid II flippase FtsW [Patescibacteria group bacterium]|nr:putative lipid II flippase FtsW [Patescibacteria group bacterium]
MFKVGHPIQQRNTSTAHQPDKKLLISIGLLIVLGLVFLSSASAAVAYTRYGSSDYFFKRQLLVAAVGLVLFYVCYIIDYRLWRKYAFFFLIISCIFLSLVFIPGLSRQSGTAKSWLDIFGFSVQPSEFVKIFFLIYLAAWLEARRKDLHDFKQGIGPFLAVLLVIAALMLLQPDLGTLAIIGSVSLIVYFVGGGKISHLAIVLLLAALALTVAIHFKPYQMERFQCAFDPSANVKAQCYQLNQSLIAVGSGGIFGRGLGQSRQKFAYLPEVYGDSIFAVMAEEIGFVFSAAFLLLYVFIFYRIILIAKRAPDLFGKLLCVGVASWLAIQTFFNVGGIIGLIPMTGVPLPFVSQGGSSLIAALIGLGIIVNISRQTVSISGR